MNRVYLHNLGCAKNQIEGEIVAGWGRHLGLEFTEDSRSAEVILVNTCAFIREAQEEAISAILEAARLKSEGKCKKLYVFGCFPQRFGDLLTVELPEVDGFFGIGQWREILSALTGIETIEKLDNPFLRRKIQTPEHYAYLRIADGCNRECSYCAIPAIRGRYKSRRPDDILEEAQMLVGQGVKELIPVAQELNSYGHDLNLGRGNQPLISLLERLCGIPGVEWVRPLYLHPPACDEKLFAFWASQPKLCQYLDLPIEHASDRILKAMRRGGGREQLHSLMVSARKQMPDVILRTSVIVGFPGETEADFEELVDFISAVKFHRLGSFEFSPESGTPAEKLPQQVPKRIRQQRRVRLMNLQREIAEEYNSARIGAIEEVVVDGYERESGYSIARSRKEAPEIDGEILILGELTVGAGYRAKITAAYDYDLLATVLGD
mgnify:CR=1 FL=1